MNLNCKKMKTDDKSGLMKNFPIKAYFSLELKDESNKENLKLFRLMVLESILEEF